MAGELRSIGGPRGQAGLRLDLALFAGLSSLTTQQRNFFEGISSMSPEQIALYEGGVLATLSPLTQLHSRTSRRQAAEP